MTHQPASPCAVLVAGLLATALLASACATASGGTPRPFPMPDGAAPPAPRAGGASVPGTTPSAGESSADRWSSVIQTALDLRGTQYRWGGSDVSGFDCSGFTQYVFARHGFALPREVRDQYREGRAVGPRDVQPGDLVFFTTTDRGASHVAISLGGDEFVHAPSSTGVVRVERLSSPYWSGRFVGARRLE